MKKLILTGFLVLMAAPFAKAELDVADFNRALAANEVYDAKTTEATPQFYGFVCYANNPRGQYFRAWGPTPYIGQRRAMQLCFQYSHWCRADGCEPW